MTYATDDIRNIALVGHAGAGKTQIVEALLQAGGKISRQGLVEHGDTVSDFDPREKELGHSLQTSLCYFDHDNVHVNLLDTPGYPDFQGRALAVLPAVDTAAIVINAQNGIEPMTELMMDSARAQNLCRLLIINRIDVAGNALKNVVDDIRARFGVQCLPINLPARDGTQVVDCFFEPIDAATDIESVAGAHEALVDQVVEVDEALMEIYLEQGGVQSGQLHEPFESALRDGHLIPICFTSAVTGAGIPELLNVFESLMPNPNEGNPPRFLKGEGDQTEAISVQADVGAHCLAHVIKIEIDPFRGRLAVLRVHQGALGKGSQLYIGDARKPLKVSHLLKLNGCEQAEIDSAVSGDICAIPRAEDVFFDAVLHDSHEEDHFHLKSVDLPHPMYGRAISARTDKEAQKVNDALEVLCAEDPSLRLEHHAAMNETVLQSMGELHLRTALDEIASKYGVEIDVSLPGIAYRETISAAAEGHYRHKKQSGGAGQFGEVFMKVEPLPRGSGFEFVNHVVGGAIPSQFIPAVEKGVREVLIEGAISGNPMQDIRAIVYDGKHHSVDSKEVAFVQAGKRAFIDAVNKAGPIILEPIVDVCVTVPEACMGDVAGDLSAMRGSVIGTNLLEGGRLEIEGQAPLKGVQDYHTRLKSLSGGVGEFSMIFSHYAPVQTQQQEALARSYRRGTE